MDLEFRIFKQSDFNLVEDPLKGPLIVKTLAFSRSGDNRRRCLEWRRLDSKLIQASGRITFSLFNEDGKQM